MNRLLETNGLEDAVALAQLVGDERALTAVLVAIAKQDPDSANVSPETMADSDGLLSASEARTILEFLSTRSYGTECDSEPWSVVIDHDACLDLLIEARKARQTLDLVDYQRNAGTVEFVCTLPSEDPNFADTDPVDFEMQQITSRLLNLCSEADDSIVITSPFLEKGGIDWLLPGIEGALQRGVDVTLVSRELEEDSPNFEAIGSVVEWAADHDASFSLHDYYEPRPDAERPLYTLHAKLLVVDDSVAYVGSANFTTYGFTEYLEVGVIVRDPVVGRLSQLLRHFLAEATREVISR